MASKSQFLRLSAVPFLVSLAACSGDRLSLVTKTGTIAWTTLYQSLGCVNRVSGIAIDPVFALKKDKHEMRAKHGLAPDRTTILLSAGGFGVGSVDALINALLPLQHRAQLVAICGRNEELKRSLTRMAARAKADATVLLKPFGYTHEMDELMTASDLVIGKPGGLTTSEALAKGLVFVIVNPIPGQEERNSDHLLEAAVAIRCNNLPTLSYKLDRLLADRSRFSSMQANAQRMGRPNAAREIVRQLISSI